MITDILPSVLLQTAYNDLCAAEKDDKLLIDMGTWHEPLKVDEDVAPTQCVVCMAGAWLAGRGIVDNLTSADVCYFDERGQSSITAQLFAINCFRQGSIKTAYAHLERVMPDKLPHKVFVSVYPNYKYPADRPYDNWDTSTTTVKAARKQFHTDMRALIALLENAGE